MEEAAARKAIGEGDALNQAQLTKPKCKGVTLGKSMTAGGPTETFTVGIDKFEERVVAGYNDDTLLKLIVVEPEKYKGFSISTEGLVFRYNNSGDQVLCIPQDRVIIT